ncbi:MAG: hypothetical protein JSV65_00745 [Armatimonadota bacterium]|nr:MAG: hypothetical protein JSV65_00745 [Armatimonadota bacterium]
MGGLIVLIALVYFALLALSLFSTIALVWLGGTVLLNAQRRGWGVWLAGCGLLAGGAVFVSHSAVLMESARVIGSELNVWWPLGWTAVIFSPFAWYIAMLWHTGYWDSGQSALRRRHRPLLAAALALVGALFVLLMMARPLPFTVHGTGFNLSTRPAVLGIPVMVLLYPVFVLSCISFSLDAVARPGPSRRPMGEPARRRARPWLAAASLALLTVSMLVVSSLIWLLRHGPGALDVVPDGLALGMLWLDLVITALITLAVVLLGQAIVAYEIFTARTLPRRGLRRQWHNVLILGAGYGVAVGGSFAVELPSAYVVVLATLLVAFTYAVFSWRSYREREQYISHLRPFVASEHVYDAVLTSQPEAMAETGAAEPFVALCRDVLGVESAYLVPAGGLSSLIPVPLVYPEGVSVSVNVSELVSRCASPDVTTVALEPDEHGGALLAVPLWGPRGMIGVLCLGEKADGGLYSEEEIEIARASGERLLDTIAGANLAQRLMALQRQRFTEMQVLDQQSRRALHDEVLPALHAAMLGLGNHGAAEAGAGALAQLTEVHRRISALLREMPAGLASQVAELGLVAAVRRMVETEFAHEFDRITWQVEPEAEERVRALPPVTGDVIFYAAKEIVRNAARHGRGGTLERQLNLSISAAWRDGLEMRIADDGIGLAAASEAQPAEGHGLALHGTMMAVIGGSLVTETKPGAGAAVTLFLPQEQWHEV